MRIVTLALLTITLFMAGCSYTPARIKSEPLVVIDERDRSHGVINYERQSEFCPPGQAKKGRC